MKKVILAIVGMMVLVGNAHARCGIDSDQWGSCAEYGNCGNMRKAAKLLPMKNQKKRMKRAQTTKNPTKTHLKKINLTKK
jgi:uncharacterized protein (DUF1499 family)